SAWWQKRHFASRMGAMSCSKSAAAGRGESPPQRKMAANAIRGQRGRCPSTSRQKGWRGTVPRARVSKLGFIRAAACRFPRALSSHAKTSLRLRPRFLQIAEALGPGLPFREPRAGEIEIGPVGAPRHGVGDAALGVVRARDAGLDAFVPLSELGNEKDVGRRR